MQIVCVRSVNVGREIENEDVVRNVGFRGKVSYGTRDVLVTAGAWLHIVLGNGEAIDCFGISLPEQ